GEINSVAVQDGLVAAAIAGEETGDNGRVAFFNTEGGTLGSVEVGVLPDMVVFTPDGSKILTANEGEPNDEYTIDPLGSVSIITVGDPIGSSSVVTLDFSAYNDRRQQLINQGVRIFGPGASVAQDLEPEFITIAEDSLAYVTLQENNALAIINVNTAEVIDIKALGFKDHTTGQPQLTEYILNELTTLPDLGTPTYGGGQPTVKLGGFSGLYYDAGASAGAELVFYAVPDRGPNDGPVRPANLVQGEASTNLRPFKLPDYQGRIAKFIVNTTTGAVTLDEQILLTRQDGLTPISGRGNIPGFDETPVVPADPNSAAVELLNEDFEDESLSPFTAVSVASNVGWEIRNFSGSDNYAEMNGFSADVASDDWLISPELNLATATAASFSFESTSNFDGPDLKVLVATDYAGDSTLATWTDLTAQATLSPGGNVDTPSGNIDLADFLGETIVIAFQYTSTAPGAGGGKRWQVDDVVVTATALTNDFVDTDGNAYNALDFDAFGGDFESVVRDPNGNFWMCDEYRPAIYAFTPAGVLIERYVPAGTSQLGSTPQPAGTYGAETLPAVYAKRRANRGFEGMALNTDDGLLYAFIQTPIYNPDNSTRNASDVIRVLAVDPADGSAVAEYVYLLENNANRAFDIGRVDKIGDVVYAGNGKFFVLERDSSVPGQDEGKKYVFSFTLTGATDIRNLPIADEDGSGGMTLEQMSADDLVAAGIQPIAKTKVLNLPSIGYLPSDKPEGIAILDDGSIAVLNDNDFGLAGAGVSDNSTLGIISFGNDNGFDASNRDDAINITNHPTLGMYQPDAIASYSVDGATYIVSANEGDARDYDAFSEETRVGDLTLDPTAYPNAAALQDDANLGRLRTTDATGDLDGDGDIDQIYSYGARSFSIFDRYGNLVFDSGNEFELVTAEAIPADFNSNNDENDSFDSRSDDKGPEPEAVEIVTKGDSIYALIGLERVGGIIVYNITDPRNPFYVSYVNNRDFSVDAQLPDDSSNPAAGDLGVEDIIYISAADSPDGQELVVTANEVSGTISLFGVNRPANEALSLRILHNNDGESKIVADTLDDGRPFGGADRFLTILEDLRDDGIASITLSSGDNYLPGKAFNASLARPDGSPLYDSEVLNAIGYDALVIGNHDFDFGPDILQRVIEETAATDPTFLSANLNFTAEPGLQALVDAGRIAKSEIVEVAGQPVGVIGLTTTSLPTISTPRGVTVDSNLVAIAQGEINALTAQGINKIILISHLQDVDEEIMLAGQLTGIDVIIAGGGDELLTNDPTNALGGLEVDGDYPRRVQDAVDSTVYIVTTPGEYRYVGNLTVDFDANGFITGIDDDSDVVPVVGDITGDPAITPIVDSINLFVEDLAANIIATTEVDLDGLRANLRTMETNQGNLITDAYLWFFDQVSDQFDFDPSLPVVAVQNGGGVRDDAVIPAGSDISEEKTFDILPFPNFVSVLEPLTPTE
ncbi:MAG: choice-of-anchor I family protein, partial [Bacteroidota bacterium]